MHFILIISKLIGYFVKDGLSPTQFFSKSVAHHVGEGLALRELLQGFVHQCLVVTPGHFGAGFEKSQGGVVHPDGNPRFTATFGLESGQRRYGGYGFGVGEIQVGIPLKQGIGIVVHSVFAEAGWLSMRK